MYPYSTTTGSSAGSARVNNPTFFCLRSRSPRKDILEVKASSSRYVGIVLMTKRDLTALARHFVDRGSKKGQAVSCFAFALLDAGCGGETPHV